MRRATRAGTAPIAARASPAAALLRFHRPRYRRRLPGVRCRRGLQPNGREPSGRCPSTLLASSCAAPCARRPPSSPPAPHARDPHSRMQYETRPRVRIPVCNTRRAHAYVSLRVPACVCVRLRVRAQRPAAALAWTPAALLRTASATTGVRAPLIRSALRAPTAKIAGLAPTARSIRSRRPHRRPCHHLRAHQAVGCA